MLCHQEIGQIDEVGQGRVDEQIPNYVQVLPGQFHCDGNDIVLHEDGCRGQKNNSYRGHVHEQVHGVDLLPAVVKFGCLLQNFQDCV